PWEVTPDQIHRGLPKPGPLNRKREPSVGGDSRATWDKPVLGAAGTLQDQEKGHHAEIRFIKKIRSLDLDQSQNYEVTCYLTWSPCPDCAQELVALTRSHPHVRLRLFTSRLYFHWFWSFQEGLRLLWRSGVQIRVMSLREFTHCWVKFVNHGGCPFEPELWDGLEHRSQSIQNRLNRILGLPPVTATCATSCPHPCCSAVLSLQDLTANFRNLQL
uniref:single-stranded DNA cytosine deaminase n=1 Tax=Urocitellus parryii TaxID=9999 RepID=A0A8D2INY6_UROPR